MMLWLVGGRGMEYIRLGRAELVVSRIGFGCAAMGGYDYGPVSDHESVQAVERALGLGVTLFDTADVYGLGHAEEVLGKALGTRRHHVVVATKFGVRWDSRGRTTRDNSGRWAEEALEGSLRRLRLDCIPLYQIHWPDHRTPIAETLGALRRFQEAGKIRYFGCCNFDAAMLAEAQAQERGLETIQVPYSVVERGWENIIQGCSQQHGVGVLTYNALAQGLLTGKYGRDSRFQGTDLRRRSQLFARGALEQNLAVVDTLRLLARLHGRTPAQIAIRWVLDSPGVSCAITGIKTPAQIVENVGALAWTMPDHDRKLLVRSYPAISDDHRAVTPATGE